MGQFTLYGDGIHDDQPAIQELIDSGYLGHTARRAAGATAGHLCDIGSDQQ